MSTTFRRTIPMWALALAILTGIRLDTGVQAQSVPSRALFGPQMGRRAPRPPQPTPTSDMLIFLQPGTDVARFAHEHGLIVQYALRSDPNAYVLRAASPQHAFTAHARMAQDGRVRAAYPNRQSHLEKFSFTPNDPYFHRDSPAVGWPGQWHLFNEFTPGLDARVMGAWKRDITGRGVLIGIVDDCLQTTHPDLAPNYVAADSWDFGQNDPDPDPVWLDDMHGTSVAGVAAARGGNGVGVTGAAPLAGLAGLRIDFSFQTEAMFVDATLYHSSGDNRDIKVKNHSYGDTFDYAPEPAMAAALATSTAAGTIHCFSAGNGRDYVGEDSNRKEPQNSPDAIAVAALGSSGQFATYSCYGANVFVTAPSSSSRFLQDASGNWGWEFGITTTDRTGDNGYNPWWALDYFPDTDYMSVFGGTSSASPLVAGVMALGKQAQPNLNTRFAKHLLARTCDVVDAGDVTVTGGGDGITPGSAWKTNAAGFHFDQNYGFGLINADAFTQQATRYSGVTPLKTETTGLVNVSEAIPDNDATGLRQTFTLNSTTPLEEVLLTLNVTHPWRGDVEAYLTSPQGTRARATLTYNPWYDVYDQEHDIHWTFCVNAFWGENPHGVWTLEVRDARQDNVGTLDSFAVTARMGTLLSGSSNDTGITVNNVAGAIGQTIPFSATLRRASDSTPLSGKTLTFKVNNAIVGTARTNASGVATCSYKIAKNLGIGACPLTVEFAGDTRSSASTGNGTLTVSQAKTLVTASAVAGARSQAVVLQATLARTTDNTALSGMTLAFKVDGKSVGTARTNNAGTSSLTYTVPSAMRSGAHKITVTFAGNSLYKASSGTNTLTVD